MLSISFRADRPSSAQTLALPIAKDEAVDGHVPAGIVNVARAAAANFAGEPGAHYLLVSTREPESEEIRSFRIVDGVVTEEEVNIVDATVDA